MSKLLLLFFLSTSVFACKETSEESVEISAIPKQQKIINKSIAFHNLEDLGNAEFNLTFRDIYYTYSNQNGVYTYSRTQKDSLERTVKDVMNNHTLLRYIEGDTVAITEERRSAFTRSVNSVIYFFRLPFGLNDPAVNKKYIGEKEIKGKNYHDRNTFDEEGGGKDFDDVFLYWFDAEDYSVDYLAYLYRKNGGGLRFREAINPEESQVP